MSALNRNILALREMSADEIQLILDQAQEMKEILSRPIKKVPTLRGKSVVTLFFENSTRTRMSFEMAAKTLSADVTGFAASTSSVAKGESLKDTILTLNAMKADAFVIRHSASGAAHFIARHTSARVINAGDGTHEHPTQGLLDMLTIRQHKGTLRGLTVAIVGDIAHSRVARSNVWGLTKMGAKVRLVGPRTLLPADVEQLPVEVHTDLRRGISGCDVVNVLRIQMERQDAGLFPSVREYAQTFGVNRSVLREAKPDVLVMHPGPMNRGIEITPDVADGEFSVVTEQVTNGVAVRMALLYLLLGGSNDASGH
ncbi:MAG: aspartate carbamoyltransferase catalytic subunit [Armatimonadota bacterium]|jgi:aspartate carbamoyltransferase catalytic subunit|nr:MAG: aspartate carbamoyltransferase [Armatimonadota bacterium]